MESSVIPVSIADDNTPHSEPGSDEEMTSKITSHNGEANNDNDKSTARCCKHGIKTPKVLSPWLPPRGFLGSTFTRGLICLIAWGTLWSVIGKELEPGGNLFSLFILIVFASFGGFLVRIIPYFTLPPLLGMLIVGFLLRNVSGINIAKDIDKKWSSDLRNTALVVILLRSGLGLDIAALRRLKCTVIRLAFTPCIVEAITVAIAAHLFLKLPWLWAFQLGFILGAVSPAVVVPSMLVLQVDGYGTKEGIPTLVMAASSCDDVLAISMFSVFLGISFSQGNIVFNIFRGPLELGLGIGGGFVIGILLWYLPYRHQKQAARNRSVILIGFGLLSLFGCNKAELPGAGALGVLTIATVAGYGWGDTGKLPVANVLAVLWDFFQPLLFGLIGAEVSLDYLDVKLVGSGIGILLIGLVLRLIVTYLVVYGNNYSTKEKIFIALSWLPKATVQAAIGSIPLDTARARGFTGKYQELLGIQIVTIAVLVILITAPIGAIAIVVAGTRFLKRDPNVLPVDKSEPSDKERPSDSDECERNESVM